MSNRFSNPFPHRTARRLGAGPTLGNVQAQPMSQNKVPELVGRSAIGLRVVNPFCRC